jgi:hypothetical protein
MSVKILTMVLLGGCVIAAAKPGDLDRKFDPELRAWVAPEHATVAPDGRPWIGGGYDQGDGYSTGDLVRLGENGGVESEPAPGYLSRMVGDLSIGGLTATSLARPFLLAGGDFLLKGESGGWLRMNAAGLASGKAFPDRTADEIITPQFERDGQLWVIRQFAGGERRVERRQSADGSLDAGFSQAGGAPPDAHTAVPGPDGSVWVLAGDGNRWLPFPGTPLPAQRLCQMDGAGNLLGAPKIFEIPRMIELVAGPAGAFRLVFGADLSRWNYWPTPTSQSLKIEWYSAGGVLERARDFNLRTYETFLWAEAADGSFVATDATTPIPGSPQFFVGAVANLRAFGPDGVENTEFITPGRVHSVRALADGKWWIDGLRRIHADGSEDPSWRIPGLSTPAQVTALHALPDGRMLAGGNFATAAGVVRNRLVVFRKNGMVDPSFVADDRIGEWRSIAVSGAAVYVVTAEPVAYGAGVRSNLVKLDPSGAILESYSPQLRGGRLAGGLQPILNSQSVSEVSGVRALDGGSILVETYSGGEVPQSSFHRLRADGSPDPAFKVLSDSPRAYDVITKMNGGFVRGAVIYRKNGSVERDLTRDQVWLRPLCEWLGGVVFLEFDNSPTGRLRLWAGNRWAAWFRPPAITNVRDGVLASPGDLGWLYVHATLAAGPAELHRLSFTGRLDRTFDSPRFGDRARQAAGDWWTAEETGRVDFDPALQESLASPQAILWHPETRRLWVGGGFNTVNGQPRDGLARIVGGVARSRENRGFSAIYETRLPAPTDSMREGDPPMGQAAKSIDTDERAAARDGSWLLARIARMCCRR